MTLQDVIQSLGTKNYLLVFIFCGIPFISFLSVLIQGDKSSKTSNIRYIYSILIYLSSIPGMAAAVLTGYSVFFIRANLLAVNVLVYFLPIISMVLTLFIIKRKNRFDDIPGFNKIQGLLILIGISFAVSLALYRTFILIGFIGGLLNLLIVAAIVFVLLKIGIKLLTGKSS